MMSRNAHQMISYDRTVLYDILECSRSKKSSDFQVGISYFSFYFPSVEMRIEIEFSTMPKF